MNATLLELARLSKHCNHPGWNGYNAKAISLSAVNKAKSLATTVLHDLPPPHVGVDNLTGRISFQWGDLRRRSLTMYISGDADKFPYVKGLSGVFTRGCISDDFSEVMKEVEACR